MIPVARRNCLPARFSRRNTISMRFILLKINSTYTNTIYNIARDSIIFYIFYDILLYTSSRVSTHSVPRYIIVFQYNTRQIKSTILYSNRNSVRQRGRKNHTHRTRRGVSKRSGIHRRRRPRKSKVPVISGGILYRSTVFFFFFYHEFTAKSVFLFNIENDVINKHTS